MERVSSSVFQITLNIVIAIILACLIWVIGPMIKFGDGDLSPLKEITPRILLISVIFLLTTIKIIIQFKINKTNNDFISTITKTEKVENNDCETHDSTLLRSKLQEALKLTAKWGHSGLFNFNAKYQLPWYVLIGPPGSGKSTAIANSGLNFPLNNYNGKAIGGVAGTRNCDWWISEDAILLDTAGRYTTQDTGSKSDTSSWKGFLKLLQQYRPKQPINGIILMISAQDAIEWKKSNSDDLIISLRKRIHEISEAFSITLPIYFVFTKLDLLDGFNEYFSDLEKTRRDNIFGITLPANTSFQDKLNYTNIELSNLSLGIYNHSIKRIHAERDSYRCAEIQAFPGSFGNFLDIAEDIVNNVFIESRFLKLPELRGIYFTSATQHGGTLDRLSASISSHNQYSNQTKSTSTGKSFFLEELFSQVIFKERHFSSLRKNNRIDGIKLYSISTICVFIFLSATYTWNNVIKHNEGYLTGIYNNHNKQNGHNLTTAGQLTAPDHIIEALKPFEMTLGNVPNEYQGISLFLDGDLARNTYINRYNQAILDKVIPYVISYLENTIERSENDNVKYSALKSYLLITDKNVFDPTSAKTTITQLMSSDIRINEIHKKSLIYHVRNSIDALNTPLSYDKELVNQARQHLTKMPINARIYEKIKSDFSKKSPLNIYDGIKNLHSLFNTDRNNTAAEIPYIYTKEGYLELGKLEDHGILSKYLSQDWVLGDSLSGSKKNNKETLRLLKEEYFKDYIESWKMALQSISIKPANNIAQSINKIELILDKNNSPIADILRVVSSNTTLSPALNKHIENKLEEKNASRLSEIISTNIGEKSAVERFFSPIHDFEKQFLESGKSYQRVDDHLNNMLSQLQEISLSPDRPQASFDLAKSLISDSGNTVTTVVLLNSIPSPFREWIKSISENSRKLVFSSAKEHINKNWKHSVYSEMNKTIIGRYPFSNSSTSEVLPEDFETMFGKDGTLESFLSNFIYPFIQNNSNHNEKSIDGVSIGLASSTTQFVRQAGIIRESYFDKKGEELKLKISLKPLFMDKSISNINVSTGDGVMEYAHGPKLWKELTSNTNASNSNVSLVFDFIDGNRSETTYHGSWALLKLMDDTQKSLSDSKRIISISFISKYSNGTNIPRATFEIRNNDGETPIGRDLLTNLKLPERL